MKYLFIFILGLSSTVLPAQKVLDQYVEQAIQNNLLVQEKKSLERRQEIRLEEASRHFGPEVNFIANYTLAAGGRNIEFPVGTLLNPVYGALNKLTESQDFPMIADQSINFLPNNFYDAKVRITQPILRPEIKYNKWIKAEEVSLSGLQTTQTIRDLVRDVKTAYIRWLQAKEVIGIMDQGIVLLKENKRIAESLIKNGQAIPSARMRIDSDLAVLNAQQQKAKADLKNAASYFNFLLHQPGDTPILSDTFERVPDLILVDDITAREELLQIKAGERIQELAMNLEEKHFAPKLGVQIDIGSQAYGVGWGGYVLGGVQLEVPIWDNKQSKLRQQEWRVGIEANQLNYEWSKQAFETQLQSEIENLTSDISIYESYSSLLTSNQRYYEETVRRYKEGLANYIELLDARTQVTNTQLQQNLAKFQSWIRQINIERIAATATIE